MAASWGYSPGVGNYLAIPTDPPNNDQWTRRYRNFKVDSVNNVEKCSRYND